jgi:hypothetical protein
MIGTRSKKKKIWQFKFMIALKNYIFFKYSNAKANSYTLSQINILV